MSIDIQFRGFDKLLKRVKTMETDLPALVKELLERLTELGVHVADRRFQSAMDLINDYDIEPGMVIWQSDTEADIVVSGSTVLFLEFGTGVKYNGDGHPWSYKDSSKYTPGSFGHHQGSSEHGWIYKSYDGSMGAYDEIATRTTKTKVKARSSAPGVNIHTYGIPPTRAMFGSYEVMRANVEKIAREVFGK